MPCQVSFRMSSWMSCQILYHISCRKSCQMSYVLLMAIGIPWLLQCFPVPCNHLIRHIAFTSMPGGEAFAFEWKTNYIPLYMKFTITYNLRKTTKAHLKAHYLCKYGKCKTTLVLYNKMKGSPSNIEREEHPKKNTTIKPNLQHRRKRMFNFKWRE